MTLATRCTACGTSFRVVQDQLKVSGGWVRCGRCNEVFNALEGLYEIFTQPVEAGAEVRTRVSRDAAAPAGGAVSRNANDGALRTGRAAETGATVGAAVPGRDLGEPDTVAGPPTEVHGSPTSALDSSSTRPVLPTEPAPWDERPAAGFEDVETRLEPRTGDETAPTPSFMQHAGLREERVGRRPGRAWGVVAVLLGVLLAAQLAIGMRDSLAAKLPALRPALAAACAVAGCRIDPPRSLAALAVEGSNLRQRPGDGAYELVVALRNRSASAVMAPAFELTLTDSQGQALIRRVFGAAELGAADPQLPAGADWNLQTVLEIADRRVAGYTVEIFYP